MYKSGGASEIILRGATAFYAYPGRGLARRF